jgi:tetratricopeptide (TPR) repeat protein
MTVALLALLLAAPERVVLVAKQTEPPGFFARLERSLGRAARRLYERDDEDVARGSALLAQDQPQAALREYDKALARLPDDPGVAFNRATALLKIDPSMAGAAASESGRALQQGNAVLKPKAAYQLGFAIEAMGRAEEAMREYGVALALDPDDVDSKVNLELLLRTQEQRRRNPSGQRRDDRPSQEGAQQKPEPQKGDAQSRQQPSPQQQPPQKSPQEQPPGQQQKPDAQEHQSRDEQGQAAQQPGAGEPRQSPPQDPSRSAGSEKPVDRTEAQRLLDALRASEKNLQTWRFAKKKTETRKRSDPEKDW